MVTSNSGILTGKYLDGIPEDSRAKLKNDMADSAFASYIKNKKEIDEKLMKLKPIADKYGCNLATLASHGALQIQMLVYVYWEQVSPFN